MALKIDELSTRELEEIADINIDIDNDPDSLLHFHLHAVGTLYKRYHRGDKTISDRWKATKYHGKFKNQYSHKRLVSLEKSPEVHDLMKDAHLHKAPQHVLTTDVLYTLFAWLTQVRLTLVRTNRIVSLVIGAFLPVWFALLGLSFGVELGVYLGVIFKAVFFPKGEEKKLPWYMRAYAKFVQHKTAIFNAALWFSINLISFVLPFIATTIIVAGFPIAVPLIISALTLLGMTADIFVDADNAWSFIKPKNNLLKKINKEINDLHIKINQLTTRVGFIQQHAHIQDSQFDPQSEIKRDSAEINKLQSKLNDLQTIKSQLLYKRKEAIITRLLRVPNNDLIMGLATVLILFPPSAIIGMALLGVVLATTTAEFAANCTLKNNPTNTFDKVRLGFVFGILLTAILLIAFPPAGLALTLPIIGAAVVLTVGTASLARRIYLADKQWLPNKIKQAWNNAKEYFSAKKEEPEIAPEIKPLIIPSPTPVNDKATIDLSSSESSSPRSSRKSSSADSIPPNYAQNPNLLLSKPVIDVAAEVKIENTPATTLVY